jgi:AcrR family transcriptional regulator
VPTTPPTRPVLRERYERRQHDVVAAAATLFAEQGFRGTSMTDLATATGLTTGGLYHYIGSKDRLLVRICDDLMDPLLADADEIVADPMTPPIEQFRALVQLWVGHVEDHADHMRVFQQERTLLEDEPLWREIRAKRKRFERILDDVMTRGEDRREMRFADRRLALHALLGMVNTTPQWYRPDGRLTADEIAAGYCAILLGE